MPIERCQEGGKRGWRWGKAGKCYTYTDEKGSQAARGKAERQGAVIEWRQHQEKR